MATALAQMLNETGQAELILVVVIRLLVGGVISLFTAAPLLMVAARVVAKTHLAYRPAANLVLRVLFISSGMLILMLIGGTSVRDAQIAGPIATVVTATIVFGRGIKLEAGQQVGPEGAQAAGYLRGFLMFLFMLIPLGFLMLLAFLRQSGGVPQPG
jgi:hypothetical protein